MQKYAIGINRTVGWRIRRDRAIFPSRRDDDGKRWRTMFVRLLAPLDRGDSRLSRFLITPRRPTGMAFRDREIAQQDRTMSRDSHRVINVRSIIHICISIGCARQKRGRASREKITSRPCEISPRYPFCAFSVNPLYFHLNGSVTPAFHSLWNERTV